MKVLETERLVLRWLEATDAAFILELVNDPSWIKYIGDRGIRTLEQARAYIEDGPVAMYHREGFGLYCTELKSSGTQIGICGLIKRDTLPDADLGFAFLPQYRGQGYACESALAAMSLGKNTFGLQRIVAITSPANEVSARLLEKLGFSFEKLVRLSEGAEELKLFSAKV